MNAATLLDMLRPCLPYILAALPFVLGTIALAAQGKLDNFLRETVAAVYRVAIRAAAELREEGIAWLRSPEGVEYRKGLALSAYDLIPAKLGPVPVGLLKMWLTRERFVALVEAAFDEMCGLAEDLELSSPLPDRLLKKLLQEVPEA